jgi:hypothetical protein
MLERIIIAVALAPPVLLIAALVLFGGSHG